LEIVVQVLQRSQIIYLHLEMEPFLLHVEAIIIVEKVRMHEHPSQKV
jgi:hypothetical protein